MDYHQSSDPLSLAPFPINALYDELLLQVLFYACDERVDVYRPAGGVWHLRHVCSRWRELVHSTPTFWNNISAMQNPRTPDTQDYHPTALARQMKACLEYSRTAPLSISINLTAYLSVNDTARRTMRGIMDHSHRLVYLHIVGFVLKRIIEGVRRTIELPNLRTFSIAGCFDSSTYQVLQSSSFLEEVNIVASTLPSASEIPWANVKKVSVRSRPPSIYGDGKFDIGALLPALPKLEELVWRSRTELEEILSPIILPHLHCLTVEHLAALHFVFPMIRVPNLSKLIVDESWTYRDHEPLLTMIQLSECCITQLEMNWEASSAVVSLLGDLEYVENLTLTFVDKNTTSEILAWLVWDAEECLLPLLQTFRIVVKPNYSEEATHSVANEVSAALRQIIPSRFTIPWIQNSLHIVKCIWYTPRAVLDSHIIMAHDLMMNFGKKSATPVEVQVIAKEPPAVLWTGD